MDLPLHWVEGLDANARCAGSGCKLCELAIPRKPNSAAVCQWEGGGKFYLLEFTSQHSLLVNDLECLQNLIIGQQLRVQRVVRDRSIDLEYSLGPRIECSSIIATNYVASIGVKQYIRAANLLGLHNPLPAVEPPGLEFGT